MPRYSQLPTILLLAFTVTSISNSAYAQDRPAVAQIENWGQSKYPVVYALLRFLLAALTRRPVNTSTSEIQGTATT